MTDPRIKAEAARWLIELESAEDTAPLLHAFESWLRQDEEHRRTYVRMKSAWRTLEELGRSRPSASSPRTTNRSPPKHNTELVQSAAISPLAVILMIVAATAIAVAVLG